MNVGDWIRKWSRLLPQKFAIIDGDRPFTYREVNERCNQMAHFLLEEGVSRGDRVGVLMYNSHEFMELYFALAKIGAICVPLNWRMAPPEIAYIVNDCRPTSLFFHDEFVDTAAFVKNNTDGVKFFVSLGKESIPWAQHSSAVEKGPSAEPEGFEEPNAEDPHLILYTSGTTGFPKGAVLSSRKTFYNALNANIFYGLTPHDIFLVSRPLFHSGGLLVDSTPVFYKGGTLIYRRRFSPQEYLEAIEKYKVTIIETSATFLNFILDECDLDKHHLKSLKCCYTGGERVSEILLRAYHQRGIRLSQIFGMTETSIVTWLPTDDAERKAGSVGRPVFHGEVKIVGSHSQEIKPGETGEIVVKGPILMSGYWNNSEITEQVLEHGWFHTGDLATIDDEGFLYIVDRKRDMYISGGENIYPAQIEKLLLSHAKIFDAAVYGVPDRKWGEVGKASIILKDGEEMTSVEVVKFLEGKIGKFKIPRYVDFVETLPRTAFGKIQKYLLARRHNEAATPTRT